MMNVLDYANTCVSEDYREDFLSLMAQYDDSTIEEVKGAFYSQHVLAIKSNEAREAQRWVV